MNPLRLLPILALMLLIGLIPAAAQVDGIIAVAWSPDGTRIALSGTNGLLQIRDANNQLIRDFPGLTVNIKSVAWSPDSTQIVTGGKDGKVIVWDASSGQQIAQLSGFDEYIFQVAWSPDGTKIAATGNRIAPLTTLIVWNALTYELYARWDAGDAFGISWKPDSSQIAVAKGTGYVSIYTPSLGPSIAAYPVDAGVLCVSWSPDGSKIALGPSIPGTPVNKVEVRDASTGTLVATYTGHTDYITAVAFSPDGQYLASASVDGTLRVWSLATGQQLASYARPPLLTTSIAWSPDGSQLAYASDTDTLQVVTLTPPSPQIDRIVFRSDQDLNLASMIVNSDGTDMQFLPFNNGENYDAACSLDGNFLAYLTPSGIEIRDAQFNLVNSIPGSQLSGLSRLTGLSIAVGGNRIAFVKVGENGQNIYLSNPDGSNLTQVTTGSSFNDNPSFSPDGTRIAFRSNRHTTVPNKREIFVVDVDGTNLTQLTYSGGFNSDPSWSPDGSRIVFSSDRLDATSLNIYVMNADGTHVTALTSMVKGGNYSPAWSPDGNVIAFVSSRDWKENYNDIYVMNSDGSGVRRITTDGYHKEIPCWLRSPTPTPTATPVGSD